MKVVLISLFGVPPIVNAQSYRAGKIAKFLRKNGHEVTVVTEKPPSSTLMDAQLKEDMERYGNIEIVVLRAPFIPRLNRINNVLNLLGIPDHSFFSVFANFAKLRSFLKRNNIECIITSNTPSAHILGSMLAQKLGIRWIADFADYWSDNPNLYMPTRFHKSFQKKLEQLVLKKANTITYPVESWEKNLGEIHPNKNLLFLPNGYDPEDFTIKLSENNHDKILSFCYFGTIYRTSNLNFVKAFVNFVQNNPEARNQVRFKLIGRISPNERKKIVNLATDYKNIELQGLIPHFNLIKEILASDFLIFSLGGGILAEYGSSSRLPICIGSGRPTIACCIPGGIFESLCRNYGCWKIVNDRNISSIEKCLEEAWDLFKSGEDFRSKRFWKSSAEDLQWNNIVNELGEYLR